MTKHLVLLQNKDLKSIEKNQGTLKQQGQTGFFVSSDSIGRAIMGHEHCGNDDENAVHQDGFKFMEIILHSPNSVQETSGMSAEDHIIYNKVTEFNFWV